MLRISTGIMMGRSQKGSPGGMMFLKWPTTPYFEIDPGEGHRHRDVPGGRRPREPPLAVLVGRQRHQAEERRDQDEEEEAAQERGVLPAVAVADVRLRDVVADEEDQPLHRRPQPPRDLAPLIAADREPGHQHHEERRQHEEGEVLGREAEEVHRVRHVVHDHFGRAVPRLRGVGSGLRRFVGRGLRVSSLEEEEERVRAHRPAPGSAGVRRCRMAISKIRKRTK
jgi:hypothetical protein